MICTKVPILPRPLTRTFHVVPASSRDVGTHFYLGGLNNPKEKLFFNRNTKMLDCPLRHSHQVQCETYTMG